jgi:PAS domain S-box-containing protein
MMKRILEEIPMAGVILDSKGAIEFCNDSLLDMSGHRREEVVGSCWFETFIPEKKRMRRKAEYLQTMEFGLPRKRYESTLLSRDGREIEVIWNCVCLRDDGGNAKGTVKLGQPMGDGDSLSEEIRRLRKYEKIGRSAAGLVHDLNNLHCFILGYSQMIIRDIPASSLPPYAVEIEAAIKKGEYLSKQLMSVIRGNERTHMADLNLRDVVEGFAKLVYGMLDDNITLKTELGEHAGLIQGDAEQIDRILMNLLRNACDAMPDGGEIRIGLSEAVFKEPVLCRGSEMASGQYVLISFADSGHGMVEESLAHVFEPFFSTKENGAGFGLTSVVDIVRAHGAHIEVSSIVGAGTTFKIYFRKARCAL